MMSEEEVLAYDILVGKYLQVLHAGFVETIINLSPSRGSFLDVGTGTGWIAIGVAKYSLDVEVVGVDLSGTMLNVARKNALQEGVGDRIRFSAGDAKSLPFEDETFDSVFCHNMLHHLPHPIEMVKEMARVAKKDGAILIRDLKRVSRPCTEFHVNVLGLPYPRIMKKRYRDSIRAALSKEEWNELFQSAHIPGAGLEKYFITHKSIERPSAHRRQDYFAVPTSLFLTPFKNMYISK
jgi:ubiquinone/menaquinone biosynthesis C-methylase UbiE